MCDSSRYNAFAMTGGQGFSFILYFVLLNCNEYSKKIFKIFKKTLAIYKRIVYNRKVAVNKGGVNYTIFKILCDETKGCVLRITTHLR